MDDEHRRTDKEIAKIERKLDKVYSQASREAQERYLQFMNKFMQLDEMKRHQVEDGRITEDEYITWRKNKIAMSQNYKDMVNALTDDMVNANEIASGIVNDHLPEVYASNYNYATYQIEHDARVDTSFTLYDRSTVERLIRDNPDIIPIQPRVDIPKDRLWNKQKINGAVTQSILQGESIPDASKRLKSVAEMNNTAAVRTARTAITAAESSGRVDSYKRAQDMGIELRQQWLATLDSRTRHSHRVLDGESIPVAKDKWHPSKFSNGLRYPGDPQGPGYEIYNCRCTLIADVEGVDQGAIDDLSLRNSSKLGDMSYEEWKTEHRKPQVVNMVGNTGKGYTSKQVDELNKLINSSDKVVQEVWNKYLPQLDEALPPDERRHGTAYYVPGGDVHLYPDRVAEGDIIHTPYQIHFHEYGHNIDWIMGSKTESGGFLTDNWRDTDGRSFEQIIQDEWRNKFTNRMSDLDIAKQLLKNQTKEGGLGIHDFIQGEITSWRRNKGLGRHDEEYLKMKEEFDSLLDNRSKIDFFLKHYEEFGSINDADREYYGARLDKNKIKDWINDVNNTYSRRDRSDVSDMMDHFADVTLGQAYPLGAGHGREYWYREGSSPLAHEAFAEMFSAEIANPGSLEFIKQTLPESYAAFRRILEGVL